MECDANVIENVWDVAWQFVVYQWTLFQKTTINISARGFVRYKGEKGTSSVHLYL